jgi:hypothetical protein
MALLLKSGYGKGVYVAYILCEDCDKLHVKIQHDIMMMIMMVMMMMMIIIIIIILEGRTCVLTNRKADHFIILLMALDMYSVMEIQEYSFSGN